MIEYFNLLSDEQNKKFKQYYNFLVNQNEHYNLTAITSYDEVYIKHFYDSLLIAKIIDFSKVDNFCDIGSGAGFPSIPLKIVYPNLNITIIEPTTKRVRFLNELVSLLALNNIDIINGRAEDKIVDYREAFDVVSARAVARLDILLELCIPYAKVGGYFIAMKGLNYKPELDDAKTTINTLNVKLDTVQTFELPLMMGERSLLKFSKNKPTNPIYPRHFSKIKKNPL